MCIRDRYDNQPDGIVFAGKILYNYKGDMPKNTDIIISNWTKAISQGAFSDCVNLRSISISNSISNISSDMSVSYTHLDVYKRQEYNGVKYYNDSIASSPTRTALGTLSLYDEKIIIIAGGYDKHIPCLLYTSMLLYSSWFQQNTT